MVGNIAFSFLLPPLFSRTLKRWILDDAVEWFFFSHPAKVVQSCGTVLEGSSVRPSVQLWIRLGSLLSETKPINVTRQHTTSVSQLGQGRVVSKWHETFLLCPSLNFSIKSLYMNWLQRQTYVQFCIHCPNSVYLLQCLRNLTHYLLVFHFLVHWLFNLFSKPFVVLWDLPFVWKLLYKYSLSRLSHLIRVSLRTFLCRGGILDHFFSSEGLCFISFKSVLTLPDMSADSPYFRSGLLLKSCRRSGLMIWIIYLKLWNGH